MQVALTVQAEAQAAQALVVAVVALTVQAEAQAVQALVVAVVALTVQAKAQAAQALVVAVVALTVQAEAQAAQALVVAAVVFQTTVMVEEVLEHRLSEVSPITNKFIKLAIACEKKRVKNTAIADDGNETNEAINGRMKEALEHNEPSVLIDSI